MRQAIHIFRKDIRVLRFEITLSLLVLGAFTVAATSAENPSPPELLNYLLPLSWLMLIARAIYNEPLPGDRQFWVTRPYRPRSLFLAKALFVLAFVALPKLFSDIVVIGRFGFSIWEEIGGLLWSQLLLLTVLVLPGTALCAVTTGIVQLVLVTSTLALAVSVWMLAVPQITTGVAWLGMEWMKHYASGAVFAMAMLATVFIQYSRRNTRAARCVAIGGFLLAFLPAVWFSWPLAFAIHAALSRQSVDTSNIRVELDTERERSLRAMTSADGVEFRIPIQLTGIPAEMRPQVDGFAATIEGPSGTIWRGDTYPPNQVLIDGLFTSLRIRADDAFYRRIAGYPVRVRGSAYLTLLGNLRRTFIPLDRESPLHPVPGVGLCSLNSTARGCRLDCRSAFRSRLDFVIVDTVGAGPQMTSFQMLASSKPVPDSYTPFPATFNLTPVALTTRHMDVRGTFRGVVITAVEPAAHIRSDFEIAGIRLWNKNSPPRLTPPLLRNPS